jgi:pimeloyl-ACP methyl ester carboxylesterase
VSASVILQPPPPGASRVRLGRDGGIGGLSWGSGPLAMVFLHANGFCASTYQSLLAPLARTDRRIVALDLRGHGSSGRAGDPSTFDRWDGHADDILEALGDPALDCTCPVVLAGHSMGGTSALLAAGRAPGMVRQLVLIDPVLLPPPVYWLARLPGSFDRMKRRFPMSVGAARRRSQFHSREQALESWSGRGAFKHWLPPFLEDYCRDGLRDQDDGTVRLSCDPAFEAACFAAQRHDPYQNLRPLAGRLQILQAEISSTTRPSGAAQIKRAGGIVTTVPGTTHFMPMTHPTVCQGALAHAMDLQPTDGGVLQGSGAAL